MRTKIIATLGPASTNYETMKAMAERGARIFRLNFSHADAAAFVPAVELIRKLEADLGYPLTAMGDLCGPKTRVGEVEGSPLTVERGQTVTLGLPDTEAKAEHKPFIPLDIPWLLEGVAEGMPVSLSDGMLQFTVTRVIEKDKCVELLAGNSGMLTSKKGIAFPGKHHTVAALQPKDIKDLHEGLDIGVDAFALSFVQTAQDIKDIQAEIKKHGTWVPVMAKLERQNAVDNLDDILKYTDAVMVARGDLGLECPMSQVPVIQKRIIRACRHAQKACVVATQMLLSMVKNPIPTRAESTDVANAILDGADGVMLSEETAMGSYPVEAVGFMNEVAGHAEDYFLERVQGPYAPKKEKNPAKYLAYAATLMADNTESKAVVCHSTSGATARLLSSRRPAPDTYCLTTDERVLRYMNFFWGVKPRPSDGSIESHLERVERFVAASDEFKKGDSVVLTSGQPTPGQTESHTNQIKIYYK